MNDMIVKGTALSALRLTTNTAQLVGKHHHAVMNDLNSFFFVVFSLYRHSILECYYKEKVD